LRRRIGRCELAIIHATFCQMTACFCLVGRKKSTLLYMTLYLALVHASMVFRTL